MKKKKTPLSILKKKKFKGVFPVSFGHSYFQDFGFLLPQEQEQKVGDSAAGSLPE